MTVIETTLQAIVTRAYQAIVTTSPGPLGFSWLVDEVTGVHTPKWPELSDVLADVVAHVDLSALEALAGGGPGLTVAELKSRYLLPAEAEAMKAALAALTDRPLRAKIITAEENNMVIDPASETFGDIVTFLVAYNVLSVGAALGVYAALAVPPPQWLVDAGQLPGAGA